MDSAPFTKEEEGLLLAHYQEMYPGFTKEYFAFLDDLPQGLKEHFGATRNITDNQKSFASRTVVQTRQELYTHLVSRGYRIELANFLTQNACEELIPHWTLAQWTVAFLRYAAKSWTSAVDSGNEKGHSESQSTQPTSLKSIRSISNDKLKGLTHGLEKIKTESDHRVLFHFTTQDNAMRIQAGINIRYCSNFSELALAGAFYLCESVPYGLHWLQTRYPGQKWAVLIFEVPDSYYQSNQCWNVEKGGEDWQRFCHYNFNEGQEKMLRHPMDKESDVIIGHICQRRVIGGSPDDVHPFSTYGEHCIQHAITSQSGADQLMVHLILNLNLE